MHRLVLILALTSACVAGSGDEGFAIVNNVAPGPNCTIAGNGGFLGRGIIDKQSEAAYVLTPELISYVTSSDGTEQQRTISLRGANVEVFRLSGTSKTSVRKFASLFSGTILPGGKTTAAFDILPQDILAASTASGTTREQYVMKVTPFGVIGGGGDTVDGVPFEYPVTVCDGCVRQVDPILTDCPLPFGSPVMSNVNGCNPAQDGAVTCCMSGGRYICPAPVAPM